MLFYANTFIVISCIAVENKKKYFPYLFPEIVGPTFQSLEKVSPLNNVAETE